MRRSSILLKVESSLNRGIISQLWEKKITQYLLVPEQECVKRWLKCPETGGFHVEAYF